MKNLELMGVQEMDAKEIVKTDGGMIQLYLAAAGAAIYLYNEGGDFIKGFREGF